MAELSYTDESFDLLWSEGAICNIGLVRVAALDTHHNEVDIVRDCGGSFGYVFFVMQKLHG
jgi:hypothetical protein